MNVKISGSISYKYFSSIKIMAFYLNIFAAFVRHFMALLPFAISDTALFIVGCLTLLLTHGMALLNN